MELNRTFSQRLRSLLIATLSISTVFIFSTCKEELINLGPNSIPDENLLEVFVDTIPVKLYSVSTEAVVTRSIGISPLGSVNDGIIGNLQTDFLTDFIYSEEPTFKDETDFDSIFIIDFSIDLVYNYNTIYGDDQLPPAFEVHEMLEPIPLYTKSDFVILPHMYDPEPLEFDISYKNKTHLTDYNQADAFDTCHIILDSSYAKRMLNADLVEEEIYESDNQQLFKNYFKGFYFSVKPRISEGGSIIQVDHSYSSITLRTKEWNDSDEKWDTVYNYFSLGNPDSEIDSGGVHLNMYRSIFSTDISSILDDTTTLNSRAYIQSLTGPQVYVKLPTLSDLRDSVGGTVSVNRAQLILPIDMEVYNNDHETYELPSLLGLMDSRSENPVIDFNLTEGHLNGKLDDSYSDDYRYILNIENHINDYLSDENSDLSNAFYLFAGTIEQVTEQNINIEYLRYIKYSPARTVLYGSTSSNPPFVRIVYSKIVE